MEGGANCEWYRILITQLWTEKVVLMYEKFSFIDETGDSRFTHRELYAGYL